MRNSQPINIEKLLSHVPLFEGLDAEEIARIAQHTREIQAAKGDVLFHAGDPCAGCHLVVYGQIKLPSPPLPAMRRLSKLFSKARVSARRSC